MTAVPTRRMRPAPWRQQTVVWAVCGAVTCVVSIAILPVSLATAIGGALLGSGMTGMGIVQRRRLLDQNRRLLAPAAQTLIRGDLQTAEQQLRALLERRELLAMVRNVATYDLGVALYRQGRHEEAIEQLTRADREPGAANVYPAIASTLSAAHALSGDLEQAKVWLQVSRERYARTKATASHPEIMADVIVSLRQGEFEAVATRFSREWAELEATRRGETLRPLRVMRAFAHMHASGAREAGVVQRMLDALYPVHRAEFEYLGKSWPAMSEFLMTSLPA